MSTWEIDNAHSSVGFSVRHMMFAKVHGSFKQWAAKVTLDEQDLTRSAVSASLDVASIFTNEEKRDGHLRSADFFDAEKHPKITFESKRVKKLEGERYELVGDLSIRGTTREVTLAAHLEGRGKDPWGQERMAFHASGTIDRGDFGLTWNQVLEAGGVLVGQKVEIEIDIQAVKKA